MNPMKEKEIIIPIRFPVSIGKTHIMPGGKLGISISIKTKWPIALAYFSLTFKLLILATQRIWECS